MSEKVRTYRDKTVTNAEFVLEEVSFINCTVRDCDLFYSGGDFDWQGGRFENCRLHWRGAAKNTVALLQAMGALPIPGAIPVHMAQPPTGKVQ